MRNYYVSFAVVLDPNAMKFTTVSHPNWPQHEIPGSPSFQVLNITYTLQIAITLSERRSESNATDIKVQIVSWADHLIV